MNVIILFVASLLICLFAGRLSADTPGIRLSIQVEGSDPGDVRMVSALSREFRKLDGISVTDIQPALKILSVVIHIHDGIQQSHAGSRALQGYAASVAIAAPDGRLITHNVHTGPTVDVLAHEIAVTLDGTVIEEMRRHKHAGDFKEP